MTKQEARHQIGQLVAWPEMDNRIDPIKTILERVGHHGVCTVSYTVESTPERFMTYKHVSELIAV